MPKVWKDVPGFDGIYEVSDAGDFRVKDRLVEKYSNFAKCIVKQKYKARILNGTPDKDGYLRVHVGVRKKKFTLGIATAVLLSFVGPPPDEGMECCHENGNPADNRLSNLRWGTHHSNNQDRVRQGTYSKGVDHPMSLLTENVVIAIYASKEKGSVIAATLNISQTTVSRIRLKKGWRYLVQDFPDRSNPGLSQYLKDRFGKSFDDYFSGAGE